MTDAERFEALLESLDREIEEVNDRSTKENLQDIHDALYSIYETMDLLESEIETLREENPIMKELLADRLTYEEKQYYKIKCGLDVGVGYGITL